MPRVKMTDDQILNGLKENFGTELTAADVRGYCASQNLNYQTITKRLENYKTGRGRWNLEVTRKAVDQLEGSYSAPAVNPVAVIETVKQNLIPEKDHTFVKFGNFDSVKKIIQSKLFYPVFITGLSGNGKTFSVEQACSQLNRELIRVNITIETDADDLLGGFRLTSSKKHTIKCNDYMLSKYKEWKKIHNK